MTQAHDRRRLHISTVPEHGLNSTDFMHATQAVTRVFGRDRECHVTFQGDQACVTERGDVILPALAEDTQLTKTEVMVSRGFTAHESSHKRYTSIDAVQLWRAEARPDKYLDLMRNAVDDLRVDHLAIRDYPGNLDNLSATTEATLQQLLAFAEENPEQARDLDVVGPVMLTAEGRRRMGYDAPSIEPALALLSDEDRRRIERMVDVAITCRNPDREAGTREVIAAAELMLAQDRAEQPPKGEGEGEGEAEGKGEGEGGKPGEAGEAGEPGKPVAGEPDDSDSESAGTPGGADGHEPTPTPTGTEGEPLSTDALAQKALQQTFSRHTHHDANAYRPYSTAYDFEARIDDNSAAGRWMREQGSLYSFNHLTSQISGRTSTMSRKLERALLSLQRRGWETGIEQGVLDPKRLTRVAFGHANVFRRREEVRELDTAITMLIDLSGSMMGARAELAGLIAIALSLVFERASIPFEVVGFNNPFLRHSGMYRPGGYDPDEIPHEFIATARAAANDKTQMPFSRYEPLQLWHFKRFDERVTQARVALSAIEDCAGGHNSDYDAVLAASRRLLWRPERRRILFVLSDGRPEYTCRYGRDHAFRHLRDLVARIEGKGIETVAIGIISDAVRSFYPRHVVVDDLDQFAKAAFDQLARVLIDERFRVDNADLIRASR